MVYLMIKELSPSADEVGHINLNILFFNIYNALAKIVTDSSILLPKIRLLLSQAPL